MSLGAATRAPDKITLSSEETQQLIEVFKACDAAETTCAKANADKANVIIQQQQLLEVTTKENADLKAKSDSNVKLYLGIVAGILGTLAISHFSSH